MITLGVEIRKVETLVDHSIKLTIVTAGEPTPEQTAELIRLKMIGHAYAMFKPETFVKEDEDFMKDLKASLDISGGKSPSERLRNVLYRVWEQDPEGYDDFNLYYVKKIETIIDHFKDKLL